MGGTGGRTGVVVVAGVIALAESKIEVIGTMKTIMVVMVEEDIDVVVVTVGLQTMEGIIVMIVDNIDEGMAGMVTEAIVLPVADDLLLVIEKEVLGGKEERVVLNDELKLNSGIENAMRSNHPTAMRTKMGTRCVIVAHPFELLAGVLL